MQRVVCRSRGGPEVLEFTSDPLPQPSSSGVLVRVEACGVAYGDAMRRQGVLSPPGVVFTPGYDAVGIVEAVGVKADTSLLGARVGVFSSPAGFGGYASHVTAEASSCVRIPPGISAPAAVSFGLNFVTARQILVHLLKLRPGQTILVHGAAGGVGTAVLELGRCMGIKVYGTASKGKHAKVRELGGTPIDYRSVDFVTAMRDMEPEGVDAVLDSIGGDHLLRSARVLKGPNARGGAGILVIVGMSSTVKGDGSALSKAMEYLRVGRMMVFNARTRIYLFSGISPLPPPLFSLSYAELCRDWEAVLAQAARGDLRPHIGAEIPFHDVQIAHGLLDDTAVEGKIVLVHGEDPHARL